MTRTDLMYVDSLCDIYSNVHKAQRREDRATFSFFSAAGAPAPRRAGPRRPPACNCSRSRSSTRLNRVLHARKRLHLFCDFLQNVVCRHCALPFVSLQRDARTRARMCGVTADDCPGVFRLGLLHTRRGRVARPEPGRPRTRVTVTGNRFSAVRSTHRAFGEGFFYHGFTRTYCT